MDSPGLRGDRRGDGNEVVRREPLLPSEREEEDSEHQRCLLLLPVLPLSRPPEESVVKVFLRHQNYNSELKVENWVA